MYKLNEKYTCSNEMTNIHVQMKWFSYVMMWHHVKQRNACFKQKDKHRFMKVTRGQFWAELLVFYKNIFREWIEKFGQKSNSAFKQQLQLGFHIILMTASIPIFRPEDINIRKWKYLQGFLVIIGVWALVFVFVLTLYLCLYLCLTLYLYLCFCLTLSW